MIPQTPSRPRPVLGIRIPAAATITIAALSLCLISPRAADKPPAKVDISKLPAPADKKVDFEKDIKPVLKKACLDCHGPDTQMSGFRIDQRDSALKGGEKGVAIRPGKSAESPLIHYVARLVKGMEMPPADDVFTRDQIALFRAWIDQGAKW
jgi:mono/diheme cytochrome c family protein